MVSRAGRQRLERRLVFCMLSATNFDFTAWLLFACRRTQHILAAVPNDCGRHWGGCGESANGALETRAKGRKENTGHLVVGTTLNLRLFLCFFYLISSVSAIFISPFFFVVFFLF